MAEITYRAKRTDWGAIWAGLFTFTAIWSIFGLLGLAIFAGTEAPAGAVAGAGMGLSLGMDIWIVVLTIIAMYVAGRETGHLAAVTNRHDGLLHGMIVFGLSVGALLMLVVVGGNNMSGNAGAYSGTLNGHLLATFGRWGWTGFLTLFLGWLAAMGGASTGVVERAQPEAVAEIRRIA